MVRHQPHITSIAPVATIGAALGHVCFPAESDRSGTSVARLDVDLALVDEQWREWPVGLVGHGPAQGAAGAGPAG